MLTRSEIRSALLSRGEEQERLFARARDARDAHVGAAVVLRGVIEVTNVCRVNCDYCPMRRDNSPDNDRYFMPADEIVERARLIRDAGIDVVLLQGGESPRELGELERAIPRIRDLWNGDVEVLLNLGNLSTERYARLRDLGAISYILKQETSDATIFERIRHERLDVRLDHARTLVRLGYHLGIGLISGLPGQRVDSIIDDIDLVGALGASMSSVSPFVPAPGTPMEHVMPGDVELALNVLATLRICYPDLLIPSVSALEKNATGGQSRGLAAGANVMTVNFTGEAARGQYLIYGRERFVVKMSHVREVVAGNGLLTRGSLFLDPARNAVVTA